MSHRHGNKGRKFGRDADQRRALIKGLASSLIDNTSIRTTLPKAKEIVPYIEKLITKAKKGDLHNRRLIISKLATIESANKLVDEIAPLLTSRTSGHLRITKDGNRRGDNAPMALVSFVDDLGNTKVSASGQKSTAPTDKSKQTAKAEEKTMTKQPSTKDVPRKISAPRTTMSNKPLVNVRKSGER